jgi:hypothetical protein
VIIKHGNATQRSAVMDETSANRLHLLAAQGLKPRLRIDHSPHAIGLRGW